MRKLSENDPIRTQSAVRNLIDNALKYSPPESAIDISIQSSPTPFIEIQDEGSGFPDDEIEALTDRFTRGSNASGSIGSGLGLTIARDVALAHKGKLIIGNSVDGGACVRFTFSS